MKLPKVDMGKIKSTVKDSTQSINESVQKSSLFQKAKGTLYEEGLLSRARDASVERMRIYRTDLLHDVDVVNKMNNIPDAQTKRVEEAVEKASKNVLSGASSSKAKGKSASPWRNATQEEIDAVDQAAQAKIYAKNRASTQTNIQQYEDEYAGALLATKVQANRYAVQEALNGYYVDPFRNGEYVVGAARAGVTAAGGIGTTALVSNVFSGSSGDYKNNSGSKRY